MKLASMVSAIAIVSGAAVAVSAGESTGGIAIGTKVPAAVAKTKMKNVDGKMLSITDVTGKAGTLVIFTCNHCPFAKAWEQRIVELANSYSGKGVGVMLVNANDPTTHPENEAFVRSNLIIEVTPDRAFGIIERDDEFAERATRWTW